MDLSLQSLSAKAEPLSPFIDHSYWLNDDNLDFNTDLFPSLPLSEIQQEKSYDTHSDSSQDEPTFDIKYEDTFSSPLYSPADSPLHSTEEKPSRSHLASTLLNLLDDCQEEPFPSWLDEKIDLHLFDAVPVDFGTQPLPLPETWSLGHRPPSALLRPQWQPEPSHHLTPPGSPPPSLLQLQPTDVAQELAAVEECVHRAAQQFSWEQLNAFAPVPSTVVPDLDANYPPSPPSPPSGSASSESVSADSESEDWSPRERSRTARAGPYTRGPEDRRSRKKEQNKNAATRYRQKKKAEVEVLAEEERILRDQRDRCAERRDDLLREVKCLKGLMRDLCRAKGLIS